MEPGEVQGEIDPAHIAFTYPTFSAARCRWVERGRRASCCYRVTRGIPRPGREPYWAEESGTLYRSQSGWSFATTVTAEEAAARRNRPDPPAAPCPRETTP